MPGLVPTVLRDAYDMLVGPKERREINDGRFGLLYFAGEEFERPPAAKERFFADFLLARGYTGSRTDQLCFASGEMISSTIILAYYLEEQMSRGR